MKTRYKILIIAISIALIASSAYIIAFPNFVIDYNTLDTPYDLEIMFDEEEYAVEYFVVNGNTNYIEIDIPTDLFDGVFMIHVNGENVDDDRVAIDGDKVIVNYGKNIENVKLFGYYEIGGLESKPEPTAEPEIKENFDDTVKVEGEMADRICKIVGGHCPPYYVGNIQPDDSLMVGMTTWDAGTKTEKQFVFIIKNDTMSYTENENVFHGKSLSYWKNLDEDSLVQYYENFGNHENFFEDLGILLIKSHSEEKLLELGIIPAHEMEIDWIGVRPSLPPRMGFDAKVNSTDGKNYLITGTIHGNVIQDNFQIAEDNGRRIGWTPAFEYNRVQINGTTALQICSMLEITCIKNPVWDAVYRHDKYFTYFYYDTYGVEPNVQIGEHYIQIDKDQVCHSFEDLLSQQISELECQKIRK